MSDPEKVSANPHRPGRVVFVDDDDEIRGLVRESFERAPEAKGVVFACCGSGKEILSRLRELQPDLILLDVHMSDMNGLDVVEALRKSEDGKDIPVIFLTGEAKLVMEDIYETSGIIGVVHKPFEAAELPARIFKIWQDHGLGVDEGQDLGEYMDREDTDTFKETN
jgi:CheY-like chemotaxis protein